MGLGRARNPSFDLDGLMDTIPSATGGVWAARYAVKLAGPFEAGQPGISHAIAIWLAAHFGGQLIGQVFGSPQKGEFARIAALGFGGDLFLRKRFLKDSKWAAEHIMLDGVDDYSSEQEQLNGFENSNQLGDSFTDAVGNQYVQTAQGWALAGLGDAQLVQGADGQVYQLGAGGEGYDYPAGYDSIMEVSGFENSTQLGFGRASGAHSSSFGYA